jgi:hypothetical protein
MNSTALFLAFTLVLFLVVIYYIYAVPPATESMSGPPLDIVKGIVIQNIMAQSRDPTHIDMYIYRDAPVFLINSASCMDCYAELFNLRGEKIGQPIGGITGYGDGQFPDWTSSAKFVRTVYTRNY